MKAQRIIETAIRNQNRKWDLLVMKKFPVGCILALEGQYEIFDKNIYEDGKINLEKIDSATLFMTILAKKGTQGVISYESFIKFTSMIRDVSAIGVNILILENNLLNRFENPCTENIPDFDSNALQDEKGNHNFALFYSFCSHEDGKEYVEYICPFVENESLIHTASLITYSKPPIEPITNVQDTIPTLSFDDDSLVLAMETLFFSGSLPSNLYLVDKREVNEHKEFGVLRTAVSLFGGHLSFVEIDDTVKNGCRTELKDLLNEIWGYPSFRNLSIYKNLHQGKDIISISQGDIIETVIQQSEIALESKKQKTMHNVLLTAPTGAGKSILFQLPAIYLARKYQALTIVVSPLVALMADQVSGLKGKYEGAATLNSMVSASEKASIMQRVIDGEINILYLAPELLLSYTISTFIGSRRIGLFIIDEAHTVTTWGRDFRVDYWFLGDYLRTAKRNLGYSFPIFALTATAVWDPSGRNDMVYDTIKSLNMDPCLKYIGVVKRSNIVFDIRNPNITTNYEREKRKLTVETIKDVVDNKKKAIIYFPYVSTVNSLMRDPAVFNMGGKVVHFHSKLPAGIKIKNANNFKDGSSPVICATKAFGMGIDVPDINVVYHYAPTGSLSDYVQEIGRLARDPQIIGTAKIDFCEKDFKYVRVLHGLSAIKPYQLRAVLKKLMSIYNAKGEKRNMLITAGDFAYIFPGDNVDYDQKLKSCLLLLSHDLLDKYGFYSLIVRPKSLFTKSYLRFKTPAESKKFKQSYSGYTAFTNDDKVIQLESDKYWEDKHSDTSFPDFKRKLALGEIFPEYEIELVVKVEITLNDPKPSQTRPKIESFFKLAHVFLDEMASSRHRLVVDDVEARLPKSMNDDEREVFMETFKSLYTVEGRNEPFCNIIRTENGLKEHFQLINGGYDVLHSRNSAAFKRFFEDRNSNTVSAFCSKDGNLVYLAELLNSLNLATYQKMGGDDPAIFVRINNPVRLGDLARSGKYENAILDNIYDRFEYSEKVFSHFFTTPMSDKQRWEFIENYFLGASEEELLG